MTVIAQVADVIAVIFRAHVPRHVKGRMLLAFTQNLQNRRAKIPPKQVGNPLISRPAPDRWRGRECNP